jgi:hypothetical protein
MLRSLTAGALAAAALLPATASAKADLGSAISLRVVDSRHATVSFASDPLPAGARIMMAPGKTSGTLRAVGKHGEDTRYASKVASKSRFRVGVRYTVRLEIPGQQTIVRKVKLIDAR